MLLALSFLAACTSVYRVPGPLASLGHTPDGEPVVAVDAKGLPSSAPRPSTRARPSRQAGASSVGQQVADAACDMVGARSIVVSGVKYRFDCSGFVEASLASAGLQFQGSTRDLFATARQRGVLHRRHRPDVGDVAFFDDTYDRDHDGRFNDPLTHVAVVTAVHSDGTLDLVHLGGTGITKLAMSLRDPEVHKDADGKLLNDYLRAPSSKDSHRVHHLSGELWVAFGSLWKPAAVAEIGAALPGLLGLPGLLKTAGQSPDRFARSE